MSEAALTPAVFEVDGKRLEFERVRATQGNNGVAISSMLAETGQVTLDPGFMNTAQCVSSITYIDGDAGILRYRGYPIEQLARRSSYLEVAYLLMRGELPTKEQLEGFEHRISRHTLLHEDFKAFFTAFPRDGHPMAVLQSSVAALSTFYPHTVDATDAEQLELASVLLMAKIPTMVAYIAKRGSGLPLLYPNSRFGFIEDFLRMTFGIPYEPHDVDPDLVAALEMLLILHADHEQNCSTSVVRVTGSSHADIYASVSAGIGALSGPLHGGANEAVLSMLQEIRDSGISVHEYVEKVKRREAGVRLMGFGHRVYKNYDPRAAIVKATADKILSKLGKRDELLDIALELEDIALNDDYFIERKLYPNVDFYTGIIYKAMGFPTRMFTPLFALGRLPGWIAQYREMNSDPQFKIGRPRQVYVGYTERHYVEIEER
jgi:citrate synthase